mmetsp:Transcript_23648/g.93773  ORF Transcript_23648/g.93773 Transcript_23648/m.93773 type:complete len:205 (-) Transcript_23648:767-1381(-)
MPSSRISSKVSTARLSSPCLPSIAMTALYGTRFVLLATLANASAYGVDSTMRRLTHPPRSASMSASPRSHWPAFSQAWRAAAYRERLGLVVSSTTTETARSAAARNAAAAASSSFGVDDETTSADDEAPSSGEDVVDSPPLGATVVVLIKRLRSVGFLEAAGIVVRVLDDDNGPRSASRPPMSRPWTRASSKTAMAFSPSALLS